MSSTRLHSNVDYITYEGLRQIRFLHKIFLHIRITLPMRDWDDLGSPLISKKTDGITLPMRDWDFQLMLILFHSCSHYRLRITLPMRDWDILSKSNLRQTFSLLMDYITYEGLRQKPKWLINHSQFGLHYLWGIETV